MRWCNPILKKEAAADTVLDFVPRKIDLGTPGQAQEYLNYKDQGSDFRMGDALRVQTGIDRIEEDAAEELIEKKVLIKLKEVQENAYKEAFLIGREEGKVEAFNTLFHELTEKLTQFEILIKSISTLKTELMNFNETHLVQLSFHLGSVLAHQHLTSNKEAIISVLRDAVGLAQEEEGVKLRVSKDQFDFIEQVKKFTEREFEFLKNIKIESDNLIKPGGCIVETNYGEVDSRIEQRVAQLWDYLQEQVPKTKPKLAIGE